MFFHQSLNNLHLPAVANELNSHLGQIFLHIVNHKKISSKAPFSNNGIPQETRALTSAYFTFIADIGYKMQQKNHI